MIRYNLMESGACGRHVSNILAVFLPWVLACSLYAGDSINWLIEFTTLFATSPINLILPPLMYIVAIRTWGRRHESESSMHTLLNFSESGETMMKSPQLLFPYRAGNALAWVTLVVGTALNVVAIVLAVVSESR